MALDDSLFPSIYTYTRASAATYFDANGVMQTAAVDEARRAHDPVTGKPLGVLIEGDGANLLLQSNDFSLWSGVATTTSTAGELGFANTWVIGDDDAVINESLSQSMLLSAGSYCLWVIVKEGTSAETNMAAQYSSSSNIGVRITWDGSGGCSVSASSGLTDAVGTIDLGGGWWLVWAAGMASANSHTVSIYPSRWVAGGTTTGTVQILHAQLEQGTRPSSVIKTTTSQVARAADNLLVTGSDFTDVFGDAEKGTVVLDFVCPEFASTGYFPLIFSIGPTFSDALYVRVRNNGQYGIVARAGGVELLGGDIAALTAGARHKLAVSWDAANVRSCLDGGAVTSAALSEPLVLLAPATIGCSSWNAGGNSTNSTVYDIMAIDVVATDEDMQEATS